MKEVYKLWLIAFLRTHPSLMFLWHDKRQMFELATTAHCQFGIHITFIRGISAAGNWTPLESFLFPLILFHVDVMWIAHRIK